MSPDLAIMCCAMIEYGMEHLGGLVGFVVRCMHDVFGIYALSNDAEEELVSAYFGRVAVSYLPPLVLNVEPTSDSHQLLGLMHMVNTAGGNLGCRLWKPIG